MTRLLSIEELKEASSVALYRWKQELPKTTRRALERSYNHDETYYDRLLDLLIVEIKTAESKE